MPTQLPSDCWQQNLDALRLVDPTCAQRLADLPIPDTVQPATGRDGQKTWQIRRDAHRIEWFGHTSMPTVSAEGLLSGFNPGAGNIALPGIGSGREAQLLSERLGRHRTAVVLETDPLNLALALRLWEVPGALRSRQIILLLADDPPRLGERLLQLCQEHPGFDLPSRMLAWPWRSKEENQAYQGVIEQVAGRLHPIRSQAWTQLLAKMKSPDGPDASPAALAVLTTVPAVVTRRLAAWLSDGAQAAGLASVAHFPESPLTAGPLAGLSAAAELASPAQAVQVLLLEQCRHHWPLAEVDRPLISWLVGVDALGEGWQFPTGHNDLAVVSTIRQREQLLARDWPEQRVLHVPIFITPKAFETPLDGPRDGVLLLADLPPEDPDQANITLYSHKMLWEALRDRLGKQGDNWTPHEAQRWLLAAQSATGIDLADPTVQEEVLERVRAVLAPAVLLNRTARAILNAGLPLRIAGRGWDRLDWTKDIHEGLADDPQIRLDLLARAKVAIVGLCRPGQEWVALEAAAAGAAIMARALWLDSDPAQLFDPNRQMLTWRTQQELVERLRGLLRNEPSRMKLTQQARQRAMKEYSAGVRIGQILEAMRAGAGIAADQHGPGPRP